jgi:Asp-tRNA(Asn)/Glu-tRNA(Gln) amidotransferase A subunit family amidase
MALTRRELIAAFLAAAGYPVARSLAQNAAPASNPGSAVSPRLETFSQWFNAPLEVRRGALQPCLERIEVEDRAIHAWKQVRPQRPTGEGALSEIPFGAKDIIETKGLATEYGSAIYKGRIGTEDAEIVRFMRNRGGVLIGKTNTTAFAYREPSPARNPRNLEHTPGGSSSGSAAAVAAGMVPVAIGTQTGGSVLRPASYCGVTGFKTTFGLLPMEGVLPYAKSFDTLGFFTHTATDMLAFWGAMGRPTGQPENFAFAVPDPLPDVDAEMRIALLGAFDRLRRAGLTLRPVNINAMLVTLHAANRLMCDYEGARFHAARYREFGDRMGPMGELVARGLKVPESEYQDALRTIAEARVRVAQIYESTPIILVPSAPGPAPKGLQSTGDPRMNSPWTSLGTPAISIPLPGVNGLPLGLQLTAAHDQDARVIQSAVRLERILASAR